MDKKQFINSIREGVLKGKAEYGILQSLTIAQAILESGWGSSQLAQMANNLFGIKAFSDWTGRRITLPTTEWYRDEKKVVNALPVDGEFGPITRQRVLDYQRNNGLEADGVVGLQTWTSIITK